MRAISCPPPSTPPAPPEDLDEVALVLLHTGASSADGAVFTVPETPGDARAKYLHTRRLLLFVGPTYWPDGGEQLVEWMITPRGAEAFAARTP